MSFRNSCRIGSFATAPFVIASTSRGEKAVSSEEVSELNALYKSSGYTHRIEAWKQAPKRGEVQIAIWMVEPNEDLIRRQLFMAGCTDFTRATSTLL